MKQQVTVSLSYRLRIPLCNKRTMKVEIPLLKMRVCHNKALNGYGVTAVNVLQNKIVLKDAEFAVQSIGTLSTVEH